MGAMSSEGDMTRRFKQLYPLFFHSNPGLTFGPLPFQMQPKKQKNKTLTVTDDLNT